MKLNRYDNGFRPELDHRYQSLEGTDGSYVGLRFSDYSRIKPENIVNIDNDNFIKLKTQKTGEQVIIPCNHIVLELFKKYESNANRLPKSLSNQKFNEYIKEVAFKTGLTEKGRLATDPNKPLYKCVSSHTSRRSFATNLYLDWLSYNRNSKDYWPQNRSLFFALHKGYKIGCG